MSQPRALPDHIGLRRLRDEAKARRRAGEFATLADARFAVAREYGFASWPRLRTHVETRAMDASARAALLVRSACSSDLRTARTLLAADPDLTRHDLATACVTGEVAEVARRVRQDPGVVRRTLAPSDWTPLLYACFSRFLRADQRRSEGIIAAVGLLLDAGADPNAVWWDGEFRQLPIHGAAGIANHPTLVRLLLDAGADPNETYEASAEAVGEALYHAAEFADPTCARMLIEAGTRHATVSYCLGRALDFPDPAMAEMFLANGATPDGSQLRKAVLNQRPTGLVVAMLAEGAPVDDADDTGVTALRLAVRWGRADVVDLLVGAGAELGAVTEDDRRIGAVLTGSAGRATAPVPPDLLDRAVVAGDVVTVRRLLAAGADVDGPPDEPPLRQAAWRGHADVVRVLVAAGAALRWDDGSPVGAALHGSLHCHDAEAGPTMHTVDEVHHGDYPAVLRVLLDAGASVPDRLWAPDLDAVTMLAELGVTTD